MFSVNNLIFLVLFTNLPVLVITLRWATLYEHWRYEGRGVCFHLPLGGCRNILNFNDQVSSLRTDFCIRLWEHIDCSGKSLDVAPPGITDLGPSGLNDQTTSISDCSRSDPGSGSNCGPGSGGYATLHEHANFEGGNKCVRLPVGGCRNLPEFNDQVSSVRTDSCIRLWEHGGCSGNSFVVNSPGVSDLGPIGFNDQTSSISDCSSRGLGANSETDE